MAKTNREIVQAVFKAIRVQDAERAIEYVSPRFVQHYSRLSDGREGFRQYILGSKPEDLQLKIVRTVADGAYVVAQIKAESSDTDMFAVYRFQNDLIAEHWAFDAPGAPPNKSGHTQVDGPNAATHLELTEKNKAFMRDYYQTFHIAGDHSSGDKYFTGEIMIRHEPGVRDGVSEFLRDVGVLMQHRTIDEVKLLIGEGDLVFIAAKGTHEGAACVYIDLYRVENEKVVEHWGFPQTAPARDESKNSNSLL